MASTIDWSLKKIFVKTEFDLILNSSGKFHCWKRQFNNFMREAGFKSDNVNWETQLAAVEACVTPTAFAKIMASHSRLSQEQKKNLEALLTVIASLAQDTDNVWIHRHAFNAYS